MKKLIILMVLFFNTACANNDIEFRILKNHKSIDAEFEPYVKEFLYISKDKISNNTIENLSMGFRDFKEDRNTIGMCHYFALEIDISKEWWNTTSSPMQRLELIFHELGHCLLKRGHTQKPHGKNWIANFERFGFKLGLFQEKDSLDDGCPASIMHPYSIGEVCINKHYNYYLDELFNKHKEDNYVEIRTDIREPSEICEGFKLINNTDIWTDIDQGTLDRAKITCKKEYNSCLKIFWKNDTTSYSALCE